jgi:hypothetical protein
VISGRETVANPPTYATTVSVGFQMTHAHCPGMSE